MKSLFTRPLNQAAAKVALLYAIFGVFWIYFSAQVLTLLPGNLDLQAVIQEDQDLTYVLVTAVMIYFLVRCFAGTRLIADEKLRESERFYRDLVEGSDDLVAQLNEQGALTYINARSRTVFGKEPEECLGLVVFDFVHPEDREETVAKFKQALQQKITGVVFENRLADGGGKPARLLWSTNIHYRPDGSVESINSIGHDITQRKQLEEMMIQSEKMISLGSLAAGMAHEINNPIAGVMQNAQVLQMRLATDSAKNQRLARDCRLPLPALLDYFDKQEIDKLVENIRQQGDRVGRIVADILDFCRTRELNPNPVDVCELLNQSVELASKEFDLSLHYDFRVIRIVREYAGDLPLLHCDRSRIQQVFVNLLRNGAHAMLTWPQPGRQPRFFLRVRMVEDCCEIEIEDNGVGMDKETCRRIFEPFFTTKEVGRGTGLGMFVAYFIVVERHGGSLQVRSQPGEGSCFTIRLPGSQATVG